MFHHLETPITPYHDCRSNYRFGPSDSVKDAMKQRDLTRSRIKLASVKEKIVLLRKQKNSEIRPIARQEKKTLV